MKIEMEENISCLIKQLARFQYGFLTPKGVIYAPVAQSEEALFLNSKKYGFEFHLGYYIINNLKLNNYG